MLRSRIDKPTLKAFGNVNLLFCGVAIALNAIVTAILTLVLTAACYWWASLEVRDE